jgi:hypothetical protein
VAALSAATATAAALLDQCLSDSHQILYRVTTILGELETAEDSFIFSNRRQPSVNDSKRNSGHPFHDSLDEKVVAHLEALDDVIFPAIDGDETALHHVEPAWQQALAELGPEAVCESRQQYLRYARATWDFLKNQTLERPHQLLAVMHIIMMLTGDDVT